MVSMAQCTALAILGGVNRAQRVYAIAFVVVVLTVVGHGTLMPRFARLKGVPS